MVFCSKATTAHTLLFLLAFFFLGPRSLLAQTAVDQSAAQNDIVVTGAPLEETSLTNPDINAATARLQVIPGAVSVVGTEDFERGRGAHLEDFIRYQPGLVIQSAQDAKTRRSRFAAPACRTMT